MNAQITIGLEDFQVMKSLQQALADEVARLKKELDAARLSGGEGLSVRLAEALGHALGIVSFGIGNLHPLTVRGWPHEKLRELAQLLPTLPGVAAEYKEASGDWIDFSKEAKRWEDARSEGREQELLAELNAARGVGSHFPVPG